MNEQGSNGQGSNGGSGYSGSTLLLLFLGGAAAGAAVAYLAQADNRARVRAFADRARQGAGQLPQAVRDASQAAKAAFAESYGSHAEVLGAVATK